MMAEQYCDQCGNHCPQDALRCNRGRIHFGQETVQPKMPDGPVGLLQKCGFVLHHGGIDPGEALSPLTVPEQAELERLLTILLADWEKRMPEGGLSRHGHRHEHGHEHP